MRVPLSRLEQTYADEVAARCAAYFTRDRFARAGGLAADLKRPERYRASRRAEYAVALMLGLEWHGSPAAIEAGFADVGEDVEVRYVTERGHRLKYHRRLDHPERRYVLVQPAIGEPEVPAEFELMGWALGRELAAAIPNLRFDDGASFYDAGRLRPVAELFELV